MLKKLYCAMIAAVIGFTAQAQYFTASPAAIYDTTAGVTPYPGTGNHAFVAMETTFSNITNEPYTYNWRNLSTDTTQNPAGWVLAGVCDNVLCLSEYGDWYYGATKTSLADVPANSNFALIIHVHAPSDKPDATGIYKIELQKLDQVDTVIFTLTKRGGNVSVATLSGDDRRVSVYPNPTVGELTVYADARLHPARISLVNMVGSEVMSQAAAEGKDINRLNLSGVAKGMYLVRVTDERGALLATRKFVKQ